MAVLLLGSCESDSGELEQFNSYSTTSLVSSNSYQSESAMQTAYPRNMTDGVALTRASTGDSDTKKAMVAYGYDEISVASTKTKVSYNPLSPVAIGAEVSGGIYMTEILRVSKNMESYRAGDYIIPGVPNAEDKDMGLKASGFYYNKLGWNPDEAVEDGDKAFAGITYVIHIMTTLGGAKLDRYYPCKPEKLVWHYTSRILSDY